MLCRRLPRTFRGGCQSGIWRFPKRPRAASPPRSRPPPAFGPFRGPLRPSSLGIRGQKSAQSFRRAWPAEPLRHRQLESNSSKPCRSPPLQTPWRQHSCPLLQAVPQVLFSSRPPAPPSFSFHPESVSHSQELSGASPGALLPPARPSPALLPPASAQRSCRSPWRPQKARGRLQTQQHLRRQWDCSFPSASGGLPFLQLRERDFGLR
mmetsp:Transcript_33055/g.65538  ORF Transcript_33055/g.65538 Transcript_33055/m.65538 type:complete len:208 (-) Transcript_33055:337-960(-)